MLLQEMNLSDTGKPGQLSGLSWMQTGQIFTRDDSAGL